MCVVLSQWGQDSNAHVKSFLKTPPWFLRMCVLPRCSEQQPDTFSCCCVLGRGLEGGVVGVPRRRGGWGVGQGVLVSQCDPALVLPHPQPGSQVQHRSKANSTWG